MLQDRSFIKQLTRLTLPMMLQNFMLALVSATDAFMLGFVSQDSLAAVSLAGQVQFVLNMFVTAMAIGTGIMAAQYWGKQDKASIESVIPVALRANLLCGAAFMLAALFFPEGLMRLFTNVEELIRPGAAYLRAVAPSYLLCGVSQIYLSTLKNTDHADVTSRISSFAVILNIILNGVLIFGLFGLPRLEIVGAAVATSIARLAELLWSMAETRQPDRVHVVWHRLLERSGIIAKDFWKYTLPVLGASLVWGIAFVLHSVILGHMGGDAVAANSIASIAKSLISCLVRGLGAGAGVIIGNTLGSGQLALAKKYGGWLTRLSIAAGVITGLLIMACSGAIVSAVGLTQTAGEYLQGMLIVCGVNVMFQSVNITVLDGIFCAGGDSRFDMFGNIGAMWCFAVPFGALAAFVFKWPVLIVYLIINLDEIVKMPAVYLHYKKYIWVRNITR